MQSGGGGGGVGRGLDRISNEASRYIDPSSIHADNLSVRPPLLYNIPGFRYIYYIYIYIDNLGVVILFLLLHEQRDLTFIDRIYKYMGPASHHKKSETEAEAMLSKCRTRVPD